VTFRFQVVIPCRYHSTRLPGKPLLDIGGKTLIQHVYESAAGSSAVNVIVATDDARIEDMVHSFGGEALLTSPDHISGTDRISEIITSENIPDEDIIVNVQGDEFAIPAAQIDQVASLLNAHPEKHMATLCEPITGLEELADPHIVKVVRDKDDNALYFSRSPVPWQTGSRDNSGTGIAAQRHVGLYAYRAGFLKNFPALEPCPLEKLEELEQLRALYNGYVIHVSEACTAGGIGIDTEDDLAKAREIYHSG